MLSLIRKLYQYKLSNHFFEQCKSHKFFIWKFLSLHELNLCGRVISNYKVLAVSWQPSLGIQSEKTTSYYPQYGMVERFHLPLKNALKARLQKGQNSKQINIAKYISKFLICGAKMLDKYVKSQKEFFCTLSFFAKSS